VQSDLYSLGVVLYQLVVGDLTSVVTSDWPEDVADPHLREDIRRCVAGRPEKRFATARELAIQLRGIENRQIETASATAAAAQARTRSDTKRRRGFIAIMIGLAMVMGLTIRLVTQETELIAFFLYISALWFSFAHVFAFASVAERFSGSPLGPSFRSVLLLFATLTVLAAVPSCVFLALARLDGSALLQICALIGMCSSAVGIALATLSFVRALSALAVVFSAWIVALVVTSGFVVKPTQMPRHYKQVSQFSPTFAAQTLIDTSFIYNRSLVGEINEDHYQAIRNLGAQDPENRTADDRFVDLRPATLGVCTLFLWGVGGTAVAGWRSRRILLRDP
jgi:hypothetical protein